MSRIKTIQGQYIDMQSLVASHENERAVSNVPINAKGDIIDNRGNVTVTREEIKKEYYKDTVVGDTTTVSISNDFSNTDNPIPEVHTNEETNQENQTTAKETVHSTNESEGSNTEEIKSSEMDSMALDNENSGPVEVNRTIRDREGTSYYEVEYDDGSFEEIDI
jgi:hypothetical protein